jgi:hypothetical protein
MKRIKRPDIIYNQRKYQKGWSGGLPETVCGSGSKLGNTQIQRDWIPAMVSKWRIQDIGDIGAGDLNWMRRMEWPDGCTYTPYDLIPRHPEVTTLDIVSQVPPRHELLMCIWVLNHFPKENARQAVHNLMASGCRYLLITWDSRLWDFLDLEPLEEIQIKDGRPPDNKVAGHDGVFLRLVKCQ